MGIIKYIDSIPLFSTSKEAFKYGIELGILKPSKGDTAADTHVHTCSVGPNSYRSGYMPGRSHKHLMMFLTSGAYVDDDYDDDGYQGCNDPDGWAECDCGVKYCKEHYSTNPCAKLCYGIDDDDDDGYGDDKCNGYGYKNCKCEETGQMFMICGNQLCSDFYEKVCEKGDDGDDDINDDNGDGPYKPPIDDIDDVDGRPPTTIDEERGIERDEELGGVKDNKGINTNYPIR